ncbi:MAG: CehA/McbA family metallohydrolase [Pseudothermotoga sp.]
MKVSTILFLFLWCFVVYAAVVSGIVIDGKDQPLVARLRFLSPENAVFLTNYTNWFGRFEQQLPAGRYTVEVSRGPEYEIKSFSIELSQDEKKEIQITLNRLYDLTSIGWFSGDAHLHTIYSDGNQDVETVARACIANGLSWAVLTDHNTVKGKTEWMIASRYGLLPILGEEVTTPLGHFNAIGINEIVDWKINDKHDLARIFTDISKQSAMSQINHPFDMKNYFVDWDIKGYDVIEIWNGGSAPNLNGMGNQEAKLFWFEILNNGTRIHATANSDCHDVYSGYSLLAFLPTDKVLSLLQREFPEPAMKDFIKSNENFLRNWVKYGLHPGTPRTYVRLEELTSSAVLKALVEGKSFMTNGPLILAEIEGKGPGETVDTLSKESLVLNLKVLSNIALEKVVVIQAGRIVQQLDVTGQRECILSTKIDPKDGSWIIVEVYGPYPVYAITNPIYLSK